MASCQNLFLGHCFGCGALRYGLTSLSSKDLGGLCWSLRHHPDLDVGDSAVDPASDSGKFDKHIRTALGASRFVQEDVLWVKIPKLVTRCGKKTRDLIPHPFLPIHERVVAALAWGDDDLVLGDKDDFNKLPRFTESDVVWEHGPCKCVCLHTYTDAAPIRGTTSAHKPDSVYVFYWCPQVPRRVCQTFVHGFAERIW